jgi:hypothetical protein
MYANITCVKPSVLPPMKSVVVRRIIPRMPAVLLE